MTDLEFKHHLYSEIEPYAQRVYKKNFANAIALGDITKIDCDRLKAEYGDRWFITGGFPCQDLSEAGKQRGITASRSSLWAEMFRVIAELRPEAAVIENVPALTYLGLERVLLQLAHIGFDAEWQVISAGEIGAPHRRKRIWIVTYASGIQQSLHTGQTLAKGADMADDELPSNPLDWPTPWSDWQGVCSRGGLCGEPLVYRMANGFSSEVDRIGCLGNAVVPQVAAQVLQKVKDAGLLTG